ncbi:hypothetical protein SAMN05428947_1187 [Mucilaginibacter sp. OK283]|jgi:hypothetical protein|nr:hypothetical protein SAMN05428947_1187 [Mucilaginibacter sp. OK283]
MAARCGLITHKTGIAGLMGDFLKPVPLVVDVASEY